MSRAALRANGDVAAFQLGATVVTVAVSTPAHDDDGPAAPSSPTAAEPSRAAARLSADGLAPSDRATRLVGVSLKMYMGLARTRDWLSAVRLLIDEQGLPDGVELFVIPTVLSLADARDVLAGTGVALGAQDVFWEDTGAYTGEISAPMLAEAGCRYVEVGHAERRRIFGETDEIVRLKVAAAVRAGLVPLLCVGESTRGRPEDAVQACARQFADATAGLDPFSPLIVAWEPVWAIGAPEPAAADYIRAVAGGLRRMLADRPAIRLLYGGSAGPGLLTALRAAVDGLFLGRFAHDVGALRRVIDEAALPSTGASS